MSGAGGELMNFKSEVQKWKIVNLSQELYEGMPAFGIIVFAPHR